MNKQVRVCTGLDDVRGEGVPIDVGGELGGGERLTLLRERGLAEKGGSSAVLALRHDLGMSAPRASRWTWLVSSMQSRSRLP